MNGNKPNVTANIDTIDKSVAKPVVKKGVIKTTHLYSCGHTEETEDNIPLKFLGKSIEQITEENPNIASLSYKDNYLICTVNETVKCKKHYKIQLSDSTLYIFSENSPDKPLEKLDIDIKGLIRHFINDITVMAKWVEIANDNKIDYIELTSNKERVSARKIYLGCGMNIKDTDVFIKQL